MGLKKREIVHNIEGVIGWGLVALLLFPSVITATVFAVEYSMDEPLIETGISVLGWSFDWVWQLMLVITFVIIGVYIISILFKKPRTA